MTQMIQNTSIIFKNSVTIHDAIGYDLPNNLFWIKTNSGCFVTGIYFDVKYKNELRNKIHDILWFFGEFDD
jgi:hypothetical protein